MPYGTFRFFFNLFSFSKLHCWFFWVFLFAFPFNIRKAFLTSHSYFTGRFVEDVTYFINFSDIVLVLALAAGGVSLAQNQGFREKLKNFFYLNKTLFCVFGLVVLWSLVGTISSRDVGLTVFGTLKLLEWGALFFYGAYFFRDFYFSTISWLVISASGTLQAAIAILQYIQQKSLGLRIIGESVLERDLPGVAKILVDGEKVIRPYGTFGHPNVLGGFLVFSLSVTLLLYLLRRKKGINIFYLLFIGFLAIMLFDHYLVTNQQGQIMLWLVLGMMSAISISNCWACDTRSGVEYRMPNIGEQSILLLLILQFIALMLTYSRTAWLGFGVVVIGITLLFFKNAIANGWSKVLGILLLGGVLSFLFLPLGTRITGSFNTSNQAVVERVSGVRTALKIIKKHPFTGVGSKNYVLNISEHETRKLEYWQYQPVHNGYVLLAAELGLVGFSLFAIFAFFVTARNLTFGGKHQK